MEVVVNNGSSNTSDTRSPATLKIKKLEYTPEILDKLDRIILSKSSSVVKRLAMKRLLGSYKECCVCAAVPEYELTYPLRNATRIERYCSECFKKREETDSKYINPNQYFVLVDKLPSSA